MKHSAAKKQRLPALLLAAILLMGALTGCRSASAGGSTSSPASAETAVRGFDPSSTDWDAIVKAARGTTVTFYGWGGDADRNEYLNTTVAQALKAQYDITLEVVGMDIDQILSQLSGEKQAGTESGSIDMIWINGENFRSARENGLLYGPFTQSLPSYQQWVDMKDTENQQDFGYPIEGYEAPYGKAQMVLIKDSARTPETPKNAQELLEFVKQYPGQVTYPAPPDFTGSAFVRNIVYELCGDTQFQNMAADKETLRAAVAPAMEYLRQLNPYLWNQGKTFPATSGEVETMFLDGELALNMSYSPFTVSTGIEKGTYPATAETFVLDNGTIGNTNYIAIAYNSPNKAGAMAAINYILSEDGQLSQYRALRTIPVLSPKLLEQSQLDAFHAVDIGQGVLTQEELLEHRLPEMPSALVPLLEEIWLEEVVGK